jgi:tetratricopeptide (TPR) repeat protein
MAGLAAARRYFGARNYAKCLEALRDAGDGALGSPDFWFLRAESLRLTGSLVSAREAAETGLQQWPEHIGLIDSLGLTLELQGDVEEADRMFRQGLSLWPHSTSLLAHHAMALAVLGRAGEARTVVEELAAVAPDALITLETRAEAAYRTHDSAAGRYVSELLEVDPENRPGHILRGNLALRSKNIGDAAGAFGMAAAIDPTNTSVAKAARASRVLAHPLLAPSRRILMLGTRRARLLYLAIVLPLFALHLRTLAFAFVLFWVVFMVVMPWALRVQQRRRYGRL